MHIWRCEWKIMLLYGVTFIINFLRILKIILYLRKKYTLMLNMYDGPSAIDVYLQKEMHNGSQYQHLIRIFDKQFFANYKYKTFTFNVVFSFRLY